MSPILTPIRPEDVTVGVALGDRLVTRVIVEPSYESVTLELTGRGAPVTLADDERLILIENDGAYDKIVRGWPNDPPSHVDRDFDQRMTTYRKKEVEDEKYSVTRAQQLAKQGRFGHTRGHTVRD
jgi:hypothetical protein